jgi:catechol 2,3-dioxygenase-like lactoylglutathione lyase family enzyme
MPAEVLQPDSNQPHAEAEDRPRFAIGHVTLTAADVRALTDFYVDIGMRPVMTTDRMAIIELLGGTHIVISNGESGGQQLDLIVDDIDETHGVLAAVGGNPSGIRQGSPHSTFTARDPEGNQLAIHSDHAIGPV